MIGTPISEVYPKDNAELQARIAKDFLVVSQVPVERFGQQIWKQNRGFFPERNVTMSALTEATKLLLRGRFSKAHVIGVFIARRAIVNEDATDEGP